MSAVDDVFDSWEEMEESGALDEKLNSLKINRADSIDDIESPRLTNHSTNNTRMIILGDDGMRSHYVNREPTVKILKRPTKNRDSDNVQMNGDKPKQPIKSLKQREKEYAEARKRILGEEKSPEELALQVSTVQPKSPSSPNITGGNNLPINVLRMPTGPDGTRGFNLRR